MKVWQQVFQELIQEVKPWHTWTLRLDETLIPNALQPGWTQYQQWVFARFQCSWCSRTWASAQVQVLFHMHWSKRESKGQVKMRIFAQRCQKCFNPPFEIPEFTEENISRILSNLVFRILEKCYKEGFKSMKEIRTVEDNYVEGPHDIGNCEACLQGFCAQSGLGLTTQPPVFLTLPVISLPTTVRTPIHKPSPTKSSTTAGAVTGGARVKREVSPNPWFPKPTQAASLRANTNYHWETRIQVPCSSENFYSHTAQNPTRRNAGICCCLIILILIIVMVAVIVVKTNV